MKNSKRKDGRVQSKVYLGSGKYKYVYADNNRELARKVDEIKLKLGKGIDIRSEKDTFKEWGDRWLRQKKTTLSAGRYNVCTYRLNDLAPLWDMPISKIKAADLTDVIYEKYACGLSQYVLNEIKNTAKQIFQLAINNRVMDFNPALAVEMPKGEPPEVRRALTPEEQTWIAAPTEHRAHRAAMIMMYAGLRRGELIPLLWTDIDLRNNTITVNKAVEVINGRTVLKDTTKTEAGMRVVYIPQLLADFLRSEKRGTNLIVCPDAHGNMMSESAFRRLWNSYMAEINFTFGNFDGIMITDEDTGEMRPFVKPKSRFAPKKIPRVIDDITPHMLRHTFVTLMYLAGVDVLTAKEQAGHKDIKTTLQIYTHLDGIYKVKQINKLDEYLSPKPDDKTKKQSTG